MARPGAGTANAYSDGECYAKKASRHVRAETGGAHLPVVLGGRLLLVVEGGRAK